MGPKKETAPPIAVQPHALKGQNVIITGEIEGRSRKAAEQILIDAGAKIEKSLNKKVQLVVLGENAGPSKLEKIEEMGLLTQTWDELIEEIKATGEDGDIQAGGDEPAEDIDEDDEEEEVEEVSRSMRNAQSMSAPCYGVSMMNSKYPLLTYYHRSPSRRKARRKPKPTPRQRPSQLPRPSPRLLILPRTLLFLERRLLSLAQSQATIASLPMQ